MDDEDRDSGARLPGDATRSQWEDENVHGRGQQAAPWMNLFAPAPAGSKQGPPLLGASPSPPRGPGPASGLEDPARRDVGMAGAGFGSACGPSERCSSSLGLACLKTEREDNRCGCARDTPVFINEGGVKKCVRAKSMYESCVSHQECSYQNPNLQCVDFLCYCPLPYVLTEAHRCLAPPVSYNNMVFTIVPTAVLIGALLMIGGAYTYKKVAGGSGGRWSSASSLFTLRSTTERPWESTRRASSAIRLNRKAGSGQRTRRPRRSLDEHREALWHARAPRHPPRYIRPREQSVQTSFLQDVRVKEESTLSSGSDSHREPARSTRTAASRQQSLSVHEGVSVHIIDKSPTSGRASQEVSTEVPWLRQARGEVSRRESPTQLLRRVLDEAEVKINVERCGSFDLHDTEQPPLPKFFGDYSGSPVSKLQGSAKGESTTEDSFMREIRYQMKAALSRPSVQDRAMSTDAALTTDSAVQLDKTAPDHVDRSQQMSDAPSISPEQTAVAPALKLVQEMEHEATVPVQKLVQEIESKQNATREPVPTAKQTEERVVISEVISQNVGKEGKPNNTDTCATRGEQKRSVISSGKPLSVLTSITSQAAESGPLLNLPDTAKNDRQRLVKSDFVYLTTENVKDVEKTEKDGSSVKFTLPTSPTFGPKVISDVSTARSPTFRDVLQELIQQHAQRKSAASSHEGAPRKNIQEKTPPQLSGSTSATAESATCPSLARKNFPLKGPVKTSSFLLKPQGVTSNSTPAMSPRFYTRRIEGSEMLCSAVQITTNAVVNEECANKTLGYGGKLSLEIKNRASPGSLNFPTTAAEESRPQLVKSFLLHTVGDDGKQDQKRAAAMQQVRHRRSSDSFVTNVDKKPSIVYASGDSFSGSVETPSDESKLEGYVSPNSPRNNGPGQAISLSQELQTTQAVVNHGLERMFMFSRIENNWSLTSPKAILGSMDIESSETSLGGLRATFKQSAGACQMVVPRDEATVAVPARKDKKTKGSKQKKRVNFHEKPFADVLAEIEHSYSDPGKVKIMEGEKETSVSKGDTAAEVSAERSNNEDKESCDDIFMQYCRGAADKNSIRECESEDGKKEKTWTPPLSIEQDVGGQQVNTQIMEQVGAQAKHKEAGRSLVEWCGPHELAVRNNELSLSNSQEAVSEESLVSHPFCPSNEGPLVPSASATLSFLSSQSCVSVVHRMTDLTVLDSLADLATPFQETGDEKSRTAAANLPYTSKPDSRALKGIHHSLRGALEQYQQGEQQWKGHSLLSTSRQTSAERSACSSRRLRKLEQANRQDSREERSRPLKRPNTDESQHTVRFAAKEQRWGDDIIQVILIGNKHYLRERSLTSPRPLSPSMAAVSPLDETRYIAQQIELTHAIKEDVAHTCPSPELCLAAGVVRTVAVPEETVITPAYARDLSACDATRASARASDTGLDQKMPSSPSSKASPQSLPGACSGPLSGVRSPDSLGATHRGTWSPSGEQPKMETIADAVCEIELQDPQAVSEALGSKISESVTGDVFSGDKIQMDKSRVQISVIEGSTDHFVPSLTFELGSESRLTPTWPQWDAPTRDLLAPVKLLSAAVGTPESFSKTIGLPSAEGLLMSDTSTPASRVNTAVPSSMDCSVVLEASASALPHARTGRPKSVRSSSHSAKIIDGPCFESIYNSILQRGSSPGLSLSIPTLGSRDSAGLFGVRERPERSASEYSTILSRHDDSTDSGAVKIVATNSRSVSLAPGFSDPQPSESCFHQALVQRTIDAATVFVEDAKKSGDEQKKSTPPSSGETPPNYNSRRGVSHPSNDLPQGDVVVSDIQDGYVEALRSISSLFEDGRARADAGSDDDERSSFFSFEESASETSLLPDGANLDWSVSSPASRSRADRG